jgi:hypothetical protein
LSARSLFPAASVTASAVASASVETAASEEALEELESLEDELLELPHPAAIVATIAVARSRLNTFFFIEKPPMKYSLCNSYLLQE